MEYEKITQKDFSNRIWQNDIDNNTHLYNYNFDHCQFDIAIGFNQGKNQEHGYIYFDDCIFNKRLGFTHMKEVVHKVTFHNCTFEEDFQLQSKLFQNKVSFENCTFKGRLILNNTTFNKLVDFNGSTFYKSLIFYKTDFLSTVVFTETTFKENVLFTYTVINKYIILRGAKVEKGLDLSLALISGGINSFDFKLENFVSVSNEENLYGYNTQNTVQIPHKNKRETFRILKAVHLRNSDSINAISYNKLEKDSFRQELLIPNRKLNSSTLKSALKNFDDNTILILNRLSNNFRKSFWRGVLFTLVAGTVFLILSFVTTGNFCINCSVNWKSVPKLFFNFLNPVHSIDIFAEFKPSFLTYLFDYLGRLIVGYGLYQSIQAFRRYNSK